MYPISLETGDQKLNESLEVSVQEKMLNAIAFAVSDTDTFNKLLTGYPMYIGERDSLIEQMADIFPYWVSPDDMEGTLRDLIEAIASIERFLPDLLEEYVLVRCLRAMAEHKAEVGIFAKDRIRDRDLIADALIKRNAETGVVPGEASATLAWVLIGSIEDYSGIPDICMYDDQYELLESYPPEELIGIAPDGTVVQAEGITGGAKRVLEDGTLEDPNADSVSITITVPVIDDDDNGMNDTI